MEILRNVLLVLHFVGLAAILGGVVAQLGRRVANRPRIIPGIMHGAWLQLISGIGLVGVIEASDGEVNNTKIGVKLLVLIVITVIAFINRKKDAVAGWVLPVIGGLTLLNIVLAVFWK